MREAPGHRPTKAQRDEVRRAQIVEAARQCVVRQGFHAASMATLAATAGMSVGQIYRYFPNKEAIVHAIVAELVARRMVRIARPGEIGRLARRLARRQLPADAGEADDHALLLEITAEAARNPAVAEIVRAADARLHAHAVATLRQTHPHFSEAEASARIELLAVLVEGAAFRLGMAPQARPAPLAALYEAVFEVLLRPPDGR